MKEASQMALGQICPCGWVGTMPHKCKDKPHEPLVERGVFGALALKGKETRRK